MLINSSSQRLPAFALILSFALVLILFPLVTSTHAQAEKRRNEKPSPAGCIEIKRSLLDLRWHIGAPRRELLPCEEHDYQIALAANQYIRVAAYLHGIDITMTAFGPDEARVGQTISPYLIEGKKSIWWTTKMPGLYRVEVRPSNRAAPAGHYDLVVQQLIEVNEQSVPFILVDQETNEGLQLQLTGTEEALEHAIPILIHASTLAQTINRWPSDGADKFYRSTTLMYLGEVYASQGEYSKALYAFQSALIAEGDPGWSLHDIGTVYEALGQKQRALDFYFRSLRAYEIRDFASRIGDGVGVERALAIPRTAIGSLYKSLGEYQLALDYLSQALQHWRKGGEIRAKPVP